MKSKQIAQQKLPINFYKLSADAVAWLHLGWIVSGAALLISVVTTGRYLQIAGVHALLTLFSWVVFKGCVLRIWENKLRSRYDIATVYEGTFVSYYANKLFHLKLSDSLVKLCIFASIIFVLGLYFS